MYFLNSFWTTICIRAWLTVLVSRINTFLSFGLFMGFIEAKYRISSDLSFKYLKSSKPQFKADFLFDDEEIML